MRCVFSTRQGIGATGIRAHDGGSSSHCGVILPAGTTMPDGRVLLTPHVHDAQPWIGVRAHPLHEWRETHTIQRVYDVPVPDEAAALASALSRDGWGYDWWRNLGYLLWREMGISGKVNCEEHMLLARLGGGLTMSDRTARTSVRMLRELAHASGIDVTREYKA
jgi:hypothetical protein